MDLQFLTHHHHAAFIWIYSFHRSPPHLLTAVSSTPGERQKIGKFTQFVAQPVLGSSEAKQSGSNLGYQILAQK